jgi:hypothetical protein
MSEKVKAPWYKPILDFIDRRFNQSFGDFIITLLEALGIFFGAILIYSLLNPVNTTDKVESTTTYSESSTVVPVYTRYNEGTENFNKVIADLEFYSTKPEKTEVTRLVMTSPNKGYDRTYSLIDGKDAESLYYHTNDYTLLPFEKTFQYLIGITDEDKEGNKGTLIFYNKVERTYTSKPIKGMKLSRMSSKGEAESYYTRKYEGYQGAPKPVYSYSPTVELVAYKDGTYEWKSNDNWKLDNEAELQSYISSSPTKEN